MAIAVQYADKGVVNGMLLDIVEVAKRHTGEHLAEAFTKVLEAFGIADKVSYKAMISYRELIEGLDLGCYMR